MKATTAIFIDKYHPKTAGNNSFKSEKEKKDWLQKHGKCAIKICITYNRERKYYPTDISLTIADFEKTISEKPREPFKTIKLKLGEYESKAAKIIEKLPVFTFHAFDKMYIKNSGASDSVKAAFEDYINELKEQKSIGTSVAYECAKRSLDSFNENLRFADVTKQLLKQYETWMIEKENGFTTISIYVRCLRTIFNRAISAGDIDRMLYPFGKGKYEIPKGRNIKKSLSMSDIKLIYNYQAEKGSIREFARDCWIFMYLCNGLNVKDMLLLKYKNIDIEGEYFIYERAKTKNNEHKIKVRGSLKSDAKDIIKKWGTKSINSESYIFPILKKGLSPERERQLIQQFTHLINDHMKEIAKDQGIVKPVTTYVARHSGATILLRSGATQEFISEWLGHRSLSTTKNYLASFEDETLQKTTDALTAFK